MLLWQQTTIILQIVYCLLLCNEREVYTIQFVREDRQIELPELEMR